MRNVSSSSYKEPRGKRRRRLAWIFHILIHRKRRGDGRTKGYKGWNMWFIKDKTSNTNAPLVPPRCFQRNCARQCFFLNWLRVLERKERICGKNSGAECVDDAEYYHRLFTCQHTANVRRQRTNNRRNWTANAKAVVGGFWRWSKSN